MVMLRGENKFCKSLYAFLSYRDGYKKSRSGVRCDFVSKQIRIILFNTSFADTSFLTGEFTQVVQFSTTNFTTTVDGDVLNERRIERENTLYTNVA